MFAIKLKTIAALALAISLAAIPVQAEGMLNGSKDINGKSTAAKNSTVSSAPEIKSTGRFGEKYALVSGLYVVLPPEDSAIPQPAITEKSKGKYSVSYAIDRKQKYSANDQAVISIIDSWNAPDAKETIAVTTQSGVKNVTGTFNMNAAKKIFMSVNEKRAAANLSTLSWDAALANAAKLRAAEITINNSHTRPDGTSCFTAVKGMTGENIADGYKTPEIAMSEWMSSPGHKANILRSGFHQLGVAAFTSGGHTYWVQDFAGY